MDYFVIPCIYSFFQSLALSAPFPLGVRLSVRSASHSLQSQAGVTSILFCQDLFHGQALFPLLWIIFVHQMLALGVNDVEQVLQLFVLHQGDEVQHFENDS